MYSSQIFYLSYFFTQHLYHLVLPLEHFFHLFYYPTYHENNLLFTLMQLEF